MCQAIFFLSTLFLLGSAHSIFEQDSYQFIGNVLGQLQNYINEENLSDTLQKVNISIQCRQQLVLLSHDLQKGEKWAIKMVDASSKLQSGLLKGNLADFGNFDECLEVNKGNTKGKYCVIEIDWISFLKFDYNSFGEMRGVNLNIKSAICIPSECTAADLKKLFPSEYLKFSEQNCQSLDTLPKMATTSYLVIILFSFVAFISLLSTSYELYITRTKGEPAHCLLLTFSIITNLKKLFTTSTTTEKLCCLNGLKAISMMWVVLGHGFMFLGDVPLTNYEYLLSLRDKRSLMFLVNTVLAVDTFLVITGVLVSFNFMKALSKGSELNIPALWLHRYLRLTPALAVLILFHVAFLNYIGTGPFYSTINDHLVDNCGQYWWSTLLYSQNFVNPDNLCLPHSWYLAVDMQLFIVSPFIMWLVWKKPKLGLAVVGLLILLSMSASFLITWFYELAASMFGHAGSTDRSYFYRYYYPTYTRMSTYFIGIIVGYFIHETRCNYIHMWLRRKAACCLWVLALSVMATCTFAGHDIILVDTHKILNNSFYNALVKPTWAASVAWIIYACAVGYGGPINHLLSLPIFQILSRLSYSLYLVHYPYIFVIYCLSRTPLEFSITGQFISFWSNYCISLILAVLLTIFFESPFIAIEKYLFRNANKTRKENESIEEVKWNSESKIPA